MVSFIKLFFLALKYKKIFYALMFLNIININSMSPLLPLNNLTFLFFKFLFLLYVALNTVLVLPYIDMNQPRVYMNSQSWTYLPPSTPYHLSGSSPCTSPKHPVSCIKHRLAIRILPDSIHVSMLFSQIIPPSPSPTESKSRFCTSVSLLLSHIEGYHYHLSIFHIYVLVYCVGVFLFGYFTLYNRLQFHPPH